MKTGKPIIGLAGGIASGKSTVAAILADCGAGIIDADRLNHQELNAPDVLERLTAWWGGGIVCADGRADRDAIRKIVAADDRERTRLEQLVHPRIAEQSQRLLDRYQADPKILAVVWDAPLLYEVGIVDRCDFVVFVEADRDTRCRRVLAERGWTAEDLDRFEGSQWPVEVKRERADFVVYSGGDLDDLRRQTEALFKKLLAGC